MILIQFHQTLQHLLHYINDLSNHRHHLSKLNFRKLKKKKLSYKFIYGIFSNLNGSMEQPVFFNGFRSRSNSPESDNSVVSNVENNIVDIMNFLSLNTHQNQQQQQHQQQQTNVLNTLNSADIELAKLQNLQTLNTLKLIQHQQQQQQQQQQFQYQQQQQQQQNQVSFPIFGLNQLLHTGCTPTQLKSFQIQQTQATSSDANLDRIARFHRSAAALYDATCYWSGTLPPRSHKIITYSPKVFLGGIPWDLTEQYLISIFKQFGNIK